MPYIDTTVWIGIDEFDDDDLIDELKSRGYSVWEKQLEKSPLSDLASLYATYQTMDRDSFEKELKKFFRDTLDVNEY